MTIFFRLIRRSLLVVGAMFFMDGMASNLA